MFLRTIVDEHYEWATSAAPRIPLGWSFFDDATGGGIAKGEVLMMLAYSGVGKTWWGGNVVINNPDVASVFFSLEMQGRALAQRLAACRYEVPTAEIEESVRLNGNAWALERLVQDYPWLAIDDTPANSLNTMQDTLQKVGDHWGRPPELVVLDYLELVKAGPALSSLEAVDKVSRSLKDFARKNDVAFIVLHQTNANEGARIQGDYGRGGGSRVDNGHLKLTRKAARFGGDVAADYTVGVYKPSLDPNLAESVAAYREHELWMQLLKNRGGNVLHLQGVEHRVDTRWWRITEKPQEAEHHVQRDHQGFPDPGSTPAQGEGWSAPAPA